MRSLDKLDPSKAALVIIDLQHDYCAYDGNAAKKFSWDVEPLDKVCRAHEEFLKQVRGLLPEKRIIWFRMEDDATQYVQGRSDFAPLCVRGTKGHEFHKVRPDRGERTFTRTGLNIFSSKSFTSFLEHAGIKQLVYTGVLLSHSVSASVIAGSSLGYESLVLDDLTANPVNLAAEYDAHRKSVSLYAPFAQSAEFVDMLKSKKQPAEPAASVS